MQSLRLVFVADDRAPDGSQELSMTIVGEMADFLLALPPRTQARLSAFVHLVENAQDVEAELDVCAHGTATLKLRHQPSTMPGAPRADPRTQQNHDRS